MIIPIFIKYLHKNIIFEMYVENFNNTTVCFRTIKNKNLASKK